MFCSDYPRGLVNCLWLWGLPAFHPPPVAPTLTVPLLLAGPGRPVSFLGLPARPLPRCFPALFAAITLARLPGTETLLAPFQQTAPHPRPTGQSRPPTLLIFGSSCRILGSAHGIRSRPEGPALEGNPFLS